MTEYQMYIDGQWCDASDGRTSQVTNPATGEVIATAPVATEEDTVRAIEAARRAFDSGVWSGMEPAQRSKIMLDLLAKFQEVVAELGELESRNLGAPIALATMVFAGTAQNRLDWFAKAAARSFEQPMPLFRAPAAAAPYIKRDPIGVCSQIVPWNAPLVQGIGSLAAPLAAGNSVVIKPATLTPCTMLEVMKLVDASDIPPGVVNLVTGSGPVVGELLASHPLVDKVTFTGSNEVGKRVLHLAADTIKNATMELGGKSANIFLDDVDIDLAVDAAMWGCFFNAGQICYTPSRALVHESMYDQFVEKIAAKASRIRVGDPAEFDTQMGPLISEGHRATVENYIAIGQQEGARLVCGGGRPAGLDTGFYLEPTIFADVDNSMRIAREEIFGPVLCVIKYSSDEEALAIANDSDFGLMGAVWSPNVERAIDLGEKLRVGNVWINETHLMSLDLPYGGCKQSGIGRERGIDGFMNEYTEVKSIQVDLGHTRAQRYWYDLVVPE